MTWEQNQNLRADVNPDSRISNNNSTGNLPVISKRKELKYQAPIRGRDRSSLAGNAEIRFVPEDPNPSELCIVVGFYGAALAAISKRVKRIPLSVPPSASVLPSFLSFSGIPEIPAPPSFSSFSDDMTANSISRFRCTVLDCRMSPGYGKTGRMSRTDQCSPFSHIRATFCN